MMENVLVVGGFGLVGKEIYNTLKSDGYDVARTFSNPRYARLGEIKFDLTKKLDYRMLEPFDTVFICAGMTDVDACEDFEKSNPVNLFGMNKFIKQCHSMGRKVVFFSSSYVFDGRWENPYIEDDYVNPLNLYGRQKVENEFLVLAGKGGLVIRTVGVFGNDNKNFISRVIKNTKEGKVTRIPFDQYMNPIWSVSLAITSMYLARDNKSGVYHVAGDTCFSKFEWAKQSLKLLNLPTTFIEGVDTDTLKQRAKRPTNGCLNCAKLEEEGYVIPDFKLMTKACYGNHQ